MVNSQATITLILDPGVNVFQKRENLSGMEYENFKSFSANFLETKFQYYFLSRKMLATAFYSYLFVTKISIPDKVTIIFIICKLRSIWCWELWFRVIEIAQNSSTFPVWSTKNTTFRFPMKMFDRSKDRYLFIWTFLLIVKN